MAGRQRYELSNGLPLRKRLPMKYFISRSLSVGLLVMFVLFTGCKPEYTIETAVIYDGPATVSDAERDATSGQLMQRLKEEFKGLNEVVSTGEGFKVRTRHQGEPVAEMAKLIAHFGSSDMGLYDMYDLQEPNIRAALDSFPWPDYTQPLYDGANPGLNPGLNSGFSPHVVVGTNSSFKMDQLKEDLESFLAEDIPVKLLWMDEGVNNSTEFKQLLYALKTDKKDGEPRIGVEGIAKASVVPTAQGEIAVLIEMTDEATAEWTAMTTEAHNDNSRQVCMVVNDFVFSTPSVRSPITGGQTMLTGNFNVEVADALSKQLQWDPLRVRLKIMSQNVVSE
jgi:hypothetical protein